MELQHSRITEYKYLFLSILLVIFMPYSNCYCFVSVLPSAGKYVVELSDDIIIKLAKIGKIEGRPALGKKLAQYATNVPEKYRDTYLKTAYLKILVAQGRLSKIRANEFMENIGEVKGFISAMSKMSGKPRDFKGLLYTSDPNAVGHGFELEFANELAKNKYRVVEIGRKFDDGIKKGLTDIDVIAVRDSRNYAFELKNYGRYLTNDNIITFKNDINTLRLFALKNKNTIPIFILSNRPSNINHINLLEAYGKYYNVNIIFGDAKTAVKIMEIIK